MLFISALFSLIVSFTTATDKGKIIIHITNIRSSEGVIAISLFKGSDGFPSDAQKCYKKLLLPISGGKATAVFDDLPYGDYAAIYMHDENKNGKMDFNFIHIPKEGYGASNDAKASMGPPEYEDAHFALKQSVLELTVKTNYF